MRTVLLLMFGGGSLVFAALSVSINAPGPPKATDPLCVGWDGGWVLQRYSLARNEWTTFKSRPVQRPVPAGAAAAVITGETGIVVVGSKWRSGAWLFDFAESKWRQFPESVASALKGTGSDVGTFVGPRLILWGMCQRSPHGSVLNVKTLEWTRLPDAPVASRNSCAHALIGDKFVVWGGIGWLDPADTTAAGPLQDGAVYDLKQNQWEKMPAPPVVFRGFHSVYGVWRDRLFVLAPEGKGKGAGLYDPAGRSWERMAAPPFEVGHLPASAIVGDRLFLWSGSKKVLRPPNDPETEYVRDGAIYDFQKKEWTKVPDAPIAGRRRGLAKAVGSHVVVWGGWVGQGGPDDTCCRDGAVYDLDKGTWRRIADLPIGIPWELYHLGP